MSSISDDDNLQEIVAKAYAAIAKPDGMVDLIAELATAEDQIDDFSVKADAHLTNAARILDTVYPASQSDYSKITTERATEIQCDLALDDSMMIVSSNAEMFEADGFTAGSPAPSYSFDPSGGTKEFRRLRDLSLDEETEFVRIFVSDTDLEGRWFSVVRTKSNQGQLFVFHAVRLRWNTQAGKAFQTALNLTDVEIALTKHLVTGGKVRSFAEIRGRSIGTVRNQLKALQRKLSIRSKEELLLLYAGFVHSIEMPTDSLAALPHHCENTFEDPVFGTIAWEEYGDPNGHPVLYFHPLEGALLTAKVQQQALNHGLRIIAPWRPYYGDTTGEGWSIGSAINFVPRVARLLDYLHVKSAVGLTTQAGSQYLMAMAKYQPERLHEGVLAAGYLPFVDRADFATIPKSHQLQMRLARTVPAFARIYQRAMLASIRDGEFYRFVENFYRNCPRELAALRTPDMLASLRRSAFYIFSKGFDGTIDTMLSWAADWSELCENISTPIQMLASEDDRAMPAEFVRKSCAKYGFNDPIFVPDTGGFMLYEEPGTVMRHIQESFERRM